MSLAMVVTWEEEGRGDRLERIVRRGESEWERRRYIYSRHIAIESLESEGTEGALFGSLPL